MGIVLEPRAADSLIDRVEEELRAYHDLSMVPSALEDLTPLWQTRVLREPHRFITDDYSIDSDALRNFRRLNIFVPDLPQWNPRLLNIKNLFSVARRGTKKLLTENLNVLKRHGYEGLLHKYPCHPAGNPYVFRHQGYRFTFRWFKHIYFLGLLNRVLGQRLDPRMVALDIGSSYGIFSSLVKKEYPESHHVLVDFPEQLILAYFFLSTCFPGARISRIRDLDDTGTITSDFIKSHDFVLVPTTHYQRMAPGTIDLVTNFTSFGEMTKSSLDYYLKSPQFTAAQYFFTSNRVQRYNDDDADVNILDYPIWEPGKRLHFAVCPVWSYYYRHKYKLFSDKCAFAPNFEYIGLL